MSSTFLNKKIIASLVAGLFLLQGCTAFEYKNYEKSAHKTHDFIESQKEAYSYKKVRDLSNPPIKPVKIDPQKVIPWLQDRVTQTSQDLPLSLALKQVLKGKAKIDFDYDVDPNKHVSVMETGSIEYVLKMLQLQANVSIKTYPDRVVVQKYIVKSFPLPAVRGDSSFQIGSNGGSSASNEDAQNGSVSTTGSGDGQYANAKSESANITDEVYEGIKAIITKPGAKSDGVLVGTVQKLDAVSTVVVRTTPSLMKQVESFVNDTVNQLTAETVLDVEVVEWQLNKGSEFGFDGLIERAIGSGSLSMAASGTQITESGDNGLGFTGSGIFDGTDILLRFLRQYGEVAITTQQTVKASNQQPQEVDLSDVRTYISKTTITYSSDDSDPAVEIDTDSVRDGVKMLVVPSVYKNHVYLRLNGTLSKFMYFDTQEIQGVTISNPRTRQSRFNVSGRFEYNKPVLVTSMKQVVEQSEKDDTAEVLTSTSGERRVVDTMVLVTPRRVMESSK